MNRQDQKILIASIIEVQELVHCLIADGRDTSAWLLLEEQQMKVERLENRSYYSESDSRRTTEADEGDGQGRKRPL